jgi:hypothetical protein
VLIAMSFRWLNTKGTVSGLGLNSVFCAVFECCATSPRSPSFLSSALTVCTLRPVEPLIALTSRLSPIPSSMPM